MGIHGNATCVMDYDGATGWLLGEENGGLQGDVHDDERGARSASACRGSPGRRGRLPERRRLCQRAAAGPLAVRRRRTPDKPADPIIVHPDIRRR